MTTTEFHEVTLLTMRGQVMTPRAATHALVERTLHLAGGRPARVADVGTGSGAIAVALALRAPWLEIWATDTSGPAVALARLNVAAYGLGDRVHVLSGDLLDPVPGRLDLVVANLPYLPEALQGHPDYRDLDDELPSAVFAAGDGLGPYRRLLDAARARLRPDGRLLLQYRAQMFEARRDELAALGRLLEPAVAA